MFESILHFITSFFGDIRPEEGIIGPTKEEVLEVCQKNGIPFGDSTSEKK